LSEPLTRERILELKPGPELDALVAQHVFGWIVLGVGETVKFGPAPSDYVYGGSHRMLFDPASRTAYDIRGIPILYSQCIHDGWRVLVACSEWPFTKRTMFFFELRGQADAKLPLEGEEKAMLSQWPGASQTLVWPEALAVLRHDFPAAVCRAALLATLEAEP
jgi:hypothetical protein